MIKREYKNLQVQFDGEQVLMNIECYKDNERYDFYKGMLNHVVEKYLNKIRVTAFVVEEKGRVFVITTVNKEVDIIIEKLFEDFDYLTAMLLSHLIDQILFNATTELYSKLHKYFIEEGLHLSSRFEPGHSNVDVRYQKDILDCINQHFDTGISITEGYMLSPSKSLSYYYEISDKKISDKDHDCSLCDDKKCKNRQYSVIVKNDGHLKQYSVKKGVNILSFLREEGLYVDSPCSGKRLCGKCKVIAHQHNLTLSKKETSFLTEKEITEGVILSCFHTIEEGLTIELFDTKEVEVNSDVITFEGVNSTYSYSFIVDIGTTSVVVALVDLSTGKIIDEISSLNPQKAYGADVISRINYCVENSSNVLSTMIQDKVHKDLLLLLNRNQIHIDKVERVMISGNTAMTYFFLGMDPSKLSVVPFEVEPGEVLYQYINSFNIGRLALDFYIFPYVSAYIGGDIVSGIYSLDIHKKDDTILFIDIGTNGEIALKTKGGVHTISTAAGPAFEGGNIRCGMPSLEGAISGFEYDLSVQFTVIGDVKPIGICGTGLIDIISELCKKGIIESNGYMSKEYIISNDVSLYPEDVRQFQLAKAAIRAGIDTILELCSISTNDIDEVFIAGGFGNKLNILNACNIGLFPKSLQEKLRFVGNTSLSGALRYVLNGDDYDIEQILSNTTYTELSSNETFFNHYISSMELGDGND